MLHVRLVSPAAITGRLTERLAAAPGVHSVVVQAGAARPDGDAVQFDVADEAANPVFAALHELALDDTGVIYVQRVDAMLTRQAPVPTVRGVLRSEHAPVWEMVRAAIRAGQVYNAGFYILLVIAGLIGAAVRSGLLALLYGFGAAIVVTLLFGLAVRGAGRAPSLFLSGVRPVADFINAPDVFSVIVAVLAGIVGVVSLTEARANALIGVFISVTTIPAAASVGISIAFASWTEAAGSALQLLLNVGVLIAVGAAGLIAQRGIWSWRSSRS